MGIDRYDLYVDEYEHEPDLHYHECGDWVRFEDHEQVVADLRAELAAKSKDAERYAWLRERAGQDDDFVQIFIDNESYAPGHLDAQVDSAMGEGNG